jgi:hypothetical protein
LLQKHAAVIGRFLPIGFRIRDLGNERASHAARGSWIF